MNTLDSYFEYFKGIVDNHKELRGFYRTNFTGDPLGDHLTLREIHEAMANVQLPAMLVQAYDMDFIDNDSDNRLQRSKASFWILQNVITFNDFDAAQQVMTEMEAIAKQVIAFIKKDLQNTMRPRIDVQYKSFSIERSGPVFGNLHGCRVDFSYDFSVNNQLVYNEAMDQYWNNPPAE